MRLMCELSLCVTAVIVILLVVGFGEFGSTIKLDPVLFTNNRVYALMNQHSGNYLTAGKGGIPYRTSDRGMHTDDQLWKVKAINKDGFQLVPFNGEPALKTVWKPIYLGYGKYQLQSLGKETCLEASTMKNVETSCNRDNLSQEWFPTLKADL